MAEDARMRELVDKLNEASLAYYNDANIMTDHEWDMMFDELRALEEKTGTWLPDSPTHNVGAVAVDSLEKFTHTYPAKSLDKTKDQDLFIQKFRDGIRSADVHKDNDTVVVMYKEDGSTAQAYYRNHKLERLVTRGNGEVGSDVTHNARNIAGLPLAIKYPGELIVRGEVLMSYEEFYRINENSALEDKYRNPRNLASATLTMFDSNESKNRKLNFKAFNLVHISAEEDESFEGYSMEGRIYYTTDYFSDRLNLLDILGFDTVDRKVVVIDNLKECMDQFAEKVKDYPFPVDGLVVAMDNYRYTSKLEGTEHHPNIMQGYAFKWADEAFDTVVRKIEWSPSRTGLLNPVAIFDPVEIDGTQVSRASLHNVSIVQDMNIAVGDNIAVYKANMIIPQVLVNNDENSHPGYTYQDLERLIGYCPTCKTKAIIHTSPDGIMTAHCPNPHCPEKMIGKLAHFCTRDCMNIDGMSEETIKKLVEAGFIKEYADFFNLYFKPEIQYLPGFGKQSWDNMCNAARSAKKTDFVRFVSALSIPNIGKGQAKTLLKYIGENYTELCKLVKLNADVFEPVKLLSYLVDANFDFSAIDGFGKILAESLSSWVKENFDIATSEANSFIKEETPEVKVYYMLEFTDVLPTGPSMDSKIAGKSFCITGKLVSFSNRQELVAKIESLGGKWVDSVSKKTDYLINNDTESTSGKNKKAKELNIPIISEVDFLAMI